MAQLFSSGWDLFHANDGGIWDTVTGSNIGSVAGAARSGARGLRIDPTAAAENYLEKVFAVAGNTNNFYAGGYIKPVTNISALGNILVVLDSLANQVGGLRIATGRTLELWGGGGGPAKIGASSAAMTIGDYENFFELTWIQSSRTLAGYLNGVQFATGAGDAGSDNADTIWLGFSEVRTGEFHIDDFKFNDQTGTVCNGRVAPTRLQIFFPAAAGDNAMGVRGGTDTGSDWGQLTQNPPDDVTTYYILDADAGGDIIDVNIEDATTFLPAASRPCVVQVGVKTRAASAASCAYQLRIKSQASGTVQLGTATTADDTGWKTNGDTLPRNFTLTAYVDPQAGLTWTRQLLDTSQIGVIATDGLPDLHITSLFAYVSYIQPKHSPVNQPVFGQSVFATTIGAR